MGVHQWTTCALELLAAVRYSLWSEPLTPANPASPLLAFHRCQMLTRSEASPDQAASSPCIFHESYQLLCFKLRLNISVLEYPANIGLTFLKLC